MRLTGQHAPPHMLAQPPFSESCNEKTRRGHGQALPREGANQINESGACWSLQQGCYAGALQADVTAANFSQARQLLRRAAPWPLYVSQLHSRQAAALRSCCRADTGVSAAAAGQEARGRAVPPVLDRAVPPVLD